MRSQTMPFGGAVIGVEIRILEPACGHFRAAIRGNGRTPRARQIPAPPRYQVDVFGETRAHCQSKRSRHEASERSPLDSRRVPRTQNKPAQDWENPTL